MKIEHLIRDLKAFQKMGVTDVVAVEALSTGRLRRYDVSALDRPWGNSPVDVVVLTLHKQKGE